MWHRAQWTDDEMPNLFCLSICFYACVLDTVGSSYEAFEDCKFANKTRLSALLFWFVGSRWFKLIVSNWQHRANVRWSRESTHGIMRDPSEIAKESWIGHLHRKDSPPSSSGLTGYLNNPSVPALASDERSGLAFKWFILEWIMNNPMMMRCSIHACA